MTDETGGGSAPALPSLSALRALRTDYEDVTVPELGGTVLRVYALSGTARAALTPLMGTLADTNEEGEDRPAVIQQVIQFQNRAVAASLGYPEEEWDAAGTALGYGVIERLYEPVARLSGLDAKAEAAATARLPRRRSVGSGTD